MQCWKTFGLCSFEESHICLFLFLNVPKVFLICMLLSVFVGKWCWKCWGKGQTESFLEPVKGAYCPKSNSRWIQEKHYILILNFKKRLISIVPTFPPGLMVAVNSGQQQPKQPAVLTGSDWFWPGSGWESGPVTDCGEGAGPNKAQSCTLSSRVQRIRGSDVIGVKYKPF